jgi:hypothetical protein
MSYPDSDIYPDPGPTDDQLRSWAEHNAHADDTPEHDDEPAAEAREAIKLTWETRERWEAWLTPDRVRKVFGLGGTPDGELRPRIRLLCEWGSEVAKLTGHQYHAGTFAHTLTQIARSEPSGLLSRFPRHPLPVEQVSTRAQWRFPPILTGQCLSDFHKGIVESRI